LKFSFKFCILIIIHQSPITRKQMSVKFNNS